ncbi:MAG: hypothetical protein COB04_15210, partial [Gammaproteobacteria bacterium]
MPVKQNSNHKGKHSDQSSVDQGLGQSANQSASDSVSNKSPAVNAEGFSASQSRLPGDLAEQWLTWQCRAIAGIIRGAIYFPNDNGGLESAIATWPDDSEAYSLKGDRRLVDTSVIAENIIGSNLKLPESFRERHFSEVGDVNSIIKEFENYVKDDLKWG